MIRHHEMNHIIIILGLAAILAYPLIMRWIAVWVQPKRLQMAALGKNLIMNGGMNQRQKYIMGSMLCDAYDYRMAILLVLVMPIFTFKIIFGTIDPAKNLFPSTDDIRKFNSLHILSVAAANPVFFAFFVVELMALVPILVPCILFRAKYMSTTPSDMLVMANTQIDRSLHYLTA